MNISTMIHPILIVTCTISILILTSVVMIMVIRRLDKRGMTTKAVDSGWSIGIYLPVSVCGAFVMSIPGLDCIPAKPLLIQAAAFLVLMWGRLAWAIYKKEKAGSSRIYIVLMVVLPFIMRPLGVMMMPVYDFLAR